MPSPLSLPTSHRHRRGYRAIAYIVSKSRAASARVATTSMIYRLEAQPAPRREHRNCKRARQLVSQPHRRLFLSALAELAAREILRFSFVMCSAKRFSRRRSDAEVRRREKISSTSDLCVTAPLRAYLLIIAKFGWIPAFAGTTLRFTSLSVLCESHSSLSSDGSTPPRGRRSARRRFQYRGSSNVTMTPVRSAAFSARTVPPWKSAMSRTM